MKRSDLTLLKVEIESDVADLEFIVAEIQAIQKDIGSAIPTHRDKAALGSFLHSFYNGIENVLKRLAEEVDDSVPVGEEWHRALLRRMEKKVENIRPQVLRSRTVEVLEPYLGFRHFFRHSYTFEVNWQKLKPLAENIALVFREFQLTWRTSLINSLSKEIKRRSIMPSPGGRKPINSLSEQDVELLIKTADR